ncbi:MFS transporter [Streptomyces sp. NPDC051133]|uniref:MFS transporter n=1 Tax=Streptomyces sp. NPDC051133 TaxID=3155521 RepID=UPI00341CFCB0
MTTPLPLDQRTRRHYNIFQLFTGLMWWLPVFYVHQRQAGLSDEQIFGIQSIYYFAYCLLEIPTGALADRFDYRAFLLTGGAALGVAHLLPVASPTYAGFLAQFLVIALGSSLISGAGSAYLYEYLARSGRAADYQQAEGSARAYTLAGRVICLPAAGVLLQWNPDIPYVLSAGGCVLAVVCAWKLPSLSDHDGPTVAGASRKRSVTTGIPRSFGALKTAPRLTLLMAQGVALFTLIRICQANLYQPVLESKHVPLAAFGVLMAATTLFEAGGAMRSSWLDRVDGVWATAGLTAMMAVALALAVPADPVGTVASLCVFSLASGLAFPIQRRLINRAIPEADLRATLLSVESLIDRAVCALVVAVLSGYLTHGSINTFLIRLCTATLAITGVITAALALLARQQSAVKPKENDLTSSPP